MKNILLILTLLTCSQFLGAQEARLEAKVSMDSILLGNYFEATFTLENISNPDFRAPEFEGFEIVAGPSQSSSFSSINGKVSQSLSYTYHLKPKDIGNYFIDPAAVEYDGNFLETEPIEIIVVPNPDGVVQQPKKQERRSFFDWGDWPSRSLPDMEIPKRTPKESPNPSKPKKKKKIYKI